MPSNKNGSKKSSRKRSLKEMEEHTSEEVERSSMAVTVDEIGDQSGVESIKESPLRTVSVAISGDIAAQISSLQLKSFVISELARILSVFRIDEVVVYGTSNDTHRLARVLQYLECPKHLRKGLFPMHNDFRHIGVCLNTGLKRDDKSRLLSCPFREGLTLRPVDDGDKSDSKEWFVDIGESMYCRVVCPSSMESDTRVTIRLESSNSDSADSSTHRRSWFDESDQKHSQNDDNKESKQSGFELDVIRGSLVTPDTPKRETNIHWGYSVRVADTADEIVSQSRFEQPYDLVIGINNRKESSLPTIIDAFDPRFRIPPFQHLLLVFPQQTSMNEESGNVDSTKFSRNKRRRVDGIAKSRFKSAVLTDGSREGRGLSELCDICVRTVSPLSTGVSRLDEKENLTLSLGVLRPKIDASLFSN